MSKSIDQHLSIRSAEFMREIWGSLNLPKLIGFCHDISFQKGELSMLSTHEAVFNLWFKKKFPAIFVNENGRTLEPGVYLGITLDQKDELAGELRSLFLSQYPASSQSVHIVEQGNDCQNLYSFVFNQPQSAFLHWIVNHVHLLQNFVAHYKYSAHELICEIQRPDNRIRLPIDNIKAKEISKLDSFNTKLIHKDTKYPIFLAKQQSICLSLLFEGLTAKEIAERMNLSFRTVQHYLARIRQIVGCATNKEIFIKYGRQIFNNYEN